MNISTVQQKCCGCRTCMLQCPVNAIAFSTDAYGFEYPVLDEDRCIHCGKCLAVCPALMPPKNGSHLRCGAALAKDSKFLKSGSSGGLFPIFAQEIIRQGGLVYGAALDKDLKLKTTKAASCSELFNLYKSKYFLCDTGESFTEIKNALEQGTPVLYCSSPCQIQALALFLKREYANLITVDFACHGVGSQWLFDKSIQYMEQKKRLQIVRYSFRLKKPNAASSHYYEFHYKKGGETRQRSGLYLYDPYYNAYQKRLACRDSCYDCHFAARERSSDITIGDFHDIEKYHPDIDRFAGVSMFVCNTEKGKTFFDQVSPKLQLYDMPWSQIVRSNRFSNQEIPPKDRVPFLNALKSESFSVVVRRYLHPRLSWKQIVYYHCPKFIRSIVLRIIRRTL